MLVLRLGGQAEEGDMPCRARLPSEAHDKVPGVIPVRAERASALVVLEVGEVAIVVLHVVDGRGALLELGGGRGKCCAGQGSEHSGDLHGEVRKSFCLRSR